MCSQGDTEEALLRSICKSWKKGKEIHFCKCNFLQMWLSELKSNTEFYFNSKSKYRSFENFSSSFSIHTPTANWKIRIMSKRGLCLARPWFSFLILRRSLASFLTKRSFTWVFSSIWEWNPKGQGVRKVDKDSPGQLGQGASLHIFV